jgi:ABC-2 type transport system permease protein
VQFWATNLADSDLRKSLERALDRELHQREFQRLGVDSETVRKVQSASVPMTSLDPRKDVGEEAVSMADKIRQYAPIGFVYFLWIAIMQVASMSLRFYFLR